MKLKSVYVRFFKSFNYDYLRKIDPNARRKPWEFIIDEQFYPHVEVPIDSQITTVVGANESGKSHLLSAIEKGLTGSSESGGVSSGIERKDFCRYSQFFQSTRKGPRYPDFGFQWGDLEPEEKEKVLRACGIEEERNFSRFFFFRSQQGCTIYLPKETEEGYDVSSVNCKLKDLMPHVFRIDSNIALPDRVSIQGLLDGRMKEDQEWWPFNRQRAFQLADAIPEIDKVLAAIGTAAVHQNTGQPSITTKLQEEAKSLRESLREDPAVLRDEERVHEIKAFNLAYDLLFKIAGIEREDIEMLQDAMRNSQTGVARSVVDKINHALAVKLRFPRIWSQDRNFALRVEATEHELNFIINDRTGCQYSFDERSSGLKHFLSYYIQYLAHEPAEGARFEILLMDEPDAFLSGEAQQDLLKIFQMFADPLQGKGENAVPVQVIYVTHSPFLIDKNHAERVRALEKPEGPKGTRVVKGAAQNRYEPLRSAFGAFVGETTFISHCNLMVEGLSDQILLAGSATYLRRLQDVPESEMLDLNHITIVPAGGADNLPYLVYLARGRDPEKPAVIALLDSDKDGYNAKVKLGPQGPHPGKKQVLETRFILQVGEISPPQDGANGATAAGKSFKVLEDLVPPPLAIRAARTFAKNIYDLPDEALDGLTEENVRQRMQSGRSVFEAIKECFAEIDPPGSIDIDKVPFARTIIDILPELARERDQQKNGKQTGLDEFEANMRALFKKLRSMQSAAEQDVKDKRMRQTVAENIDTFLSDFSDSHAATRDDVARMLGNIESDLEGDENERAFIIQEITKLRQAHELSDDPTELVRDFDSLLSGLERLRNARELAASAVDTAVPSRKKIKSTGPTTPAPVATQAAPPKEDVAAPESSASAGE
jgi:predicted ATPase